MQSAGTEVPISVLISNHTTQHAIHRHYIVSTSSGNHCIGDHDAGLESRIVATLR